MTKRSRFFPLLVLAFGLSAGLVGWAGDKDDDDDKKGGKETIELDEVLFFFELNTTDEDLGVQLVLDADPWKRMKIRDPKGKTILDIKGKGRLKNFGLSSLFFESNEPNFEDMSQQEILDLFPAGEYEFEGRTVEGDKLVGTAELTHDLPAGAEITSPEEGDVVDPDTLEIKWLAVTSPSGIEIESYEVIVTNDEEPRFVYDIRLPAAATSVTVPAEFFEEDTEYELEVLAVEASGNQSITVVFFKTE